MNEKTLIVPKVRVVNFGRLYVDPKIEIRWALDYHGRPSKFGMWSQPGRLMTEIAAAQKQDGISWARVEAKDVETRHISTMIECPGDDWIEFRWIVAGPLPVSGSRVKKLTEKIAADIGGLVELRYEGNVQGMTLVSRYRKDHVFRDGMIVSEPNDEGAVTSHAWGI